MSESWPPKLGDVWGYPFLWSSQHERGETEGRKHRPVSLVLLVQNSEGQHVAYLVLVTSKEPTGKTSAVEVPEIEKKRAGLDRSLRLWVVVDEVNTDTPSNSYYFEPDAKLGVFSTSFVKRVQAKMIEVLKAQKLRRVDRKS